MKEEITIIGSGLAAVTIARVFLENGKKVTMITSKFVRNYEVKEKDKHLSARINDFSKQINSDFKVRNKIKCKNFSVFGSMDVGGLANIWGGTYYDNNKEFNFHRFKKYFNPCFKENESSNLLNYNFKSITNKLLSFEPPRFIKSVNRRSIIHVKKI